MELTSAIVGIICILLFFTPVYLLNRAGSMRKKKRLSALLAFAEKNGLKLLSVDAWNEFAIGTDGRYVVYVKNTEDDHREILIDLKEIARCSINNISREAKIGNTTRRMVDRLELQVFHKKPEMAVIPLEFYDGQKHFQLTGEIQLAEKWKKLLDEAL